ncbi:MAG: glucose 1-dehydrogenase [Gammaproteobacteria bacterium]|nr:glucose 1-dehydrogenase [Gammaproteobacteria bacterium]
MGRLKDKVAIVIGGSKGIGLASAQLFASEGAKVVITGRDLEVLNQAKDLIQGNVMAVQGDISCLGHLEELYEKTYKEYGYVDILFSNAGIVHPAWLKDVTEEIFDELISVNYKGTFFAVQKGIPYFNKGASIILNASIAGLFGIDKDSVYSTTKAAVIQMAKNFAADLVALNIRVNSISPGFIKTPLTDKWLEAQPEKYHAFRKKIPLGQRVASADEIAKVVLFLASGDSSYVTGQNLVVDGGLSTLFIENT